MRFLTRSKVLVVLSVFLFLAAIYCLLGAFMNASFAIANSEYAAHFQGAADFFFYLFVALLASSVVSAVAAWRSRRPRTPRNGEA